MTNARNSTMFKKKDVQLGPSYTAIINVGLANIAGASMYDTTEDAFSALLISIFQGHGVIAFVLATEGAETIVTEDNNELGV